MTKLFLPFCLDILCWIEALLLALNFLCVSSMAPLNRTYTAITILLWLIHVPRIGTTLIQLKRRWLNSISADRSWSATLEFDQRWPSWAAKLELISGDGVDQRWGDKHSRWSWIFSNGKITAETIRPNCGSSNVRYFTFHYTCISNWKILKKNTNWKKRYYKKWFSK